MLLRIWLALIFVVVGYVLTLFLNINSHTNMAYDARKNELRHIVSLAKNTIEPLLEKQNAGLITKEESIQAGGILHLIPKVLYTFYSLNFECRYSDGVSKAHYFTAFK